MLAETWDSPTICPPALIANADVHVVPPRLPGLPLPAPPNAVPTRRASRFESVTRIRAVLNHARMYGTAIGGGQLAIGLTA